MKAVPTFLKKEKLTTWDPTSKVKCQHPRKEAAPTTYGFPVSSPIPVFLAMTRRSWGGGGRGGGEGWSYVTSTNKCGRSAQRKRRSERGKRSLREDVQS